MIVMTAMIILIIIVLILVTGSMYLVHYAVYPKLFSYEEAYAIEERKGFLKDYDSLEKKDYIVRSFDGYELHCQYIPAEKPTDHFVIITHGYTYNLLGSIKYMHVFRDLGYSCILYDDRGHGKNKRCVCSFGLKESKDLLEVIADAKNRFGKNISIGLHGESMGTAISIMSLMYHPDVDFVVADCGYGSLPRELSYQLHKTFHLPGWLLRVVDLLGRSVSHYSFYSVIPENALKENVIPVCFIHGDADGFIPYSESQSMASVTKGYQELHLIKGADHAKSYEVNPQQYAEIVCSFLRHVEGKDHV